MRAYRKLLSLFGEGQAKQTARTYAQAGDSARDAQDWKRAAQEYAQALKIHKNWPGIWVQYGHALKEAGDSGAAEGAYRQALNLEPENPDTHLQLGHVLKLLGRRNDAIRAYAIALKLNPHMKFARDELHGLGLTTTQINAEVARASVSLSGQVPIKPRNKPRISFGEVHTVQHRRIGVTVRGLSADRYPISLVARSARAELASMAIKQEGLDDVIDVWLDIPSDLAISDQVQVHVFLEPMGIELDGSPIVLVGSEAADLQSRLERLEIVTATLDKRTQNNGAEEWAALSSQIMSEVQALLDQQQMMFERHIVAGARVSRSSSSQDHSVPQRINAADPFRGFGWFGPETSTNGLTARWMGRRALLLVEGARSGSWVVTIGISELMSQHLLNLISLSVRGTLLTHWITQDKNGWLLRAIIDADLTSTNDVVGIGIEVRDAIYAGGNDKRRLTFAVSYVEMLPIGVLGLNQEMTLDRLSPFIMPPPSDKKLRIIAPGLTNAAVGLIKVEGTVPTVKVTVNGRSVDAALTAPGQLNISLALDIVHFSHNCVEVAGLGIDQFVSMTIRH